MSFTQTPLVIVYLLFTFCLDTKSNKKVKAPEKWLKFSLLRYNEEAYYQPISFSAKTYGISISLLHIFVV
jgi:hypothetical protein